MIYSFVKMLVSSPFFPHWLEFLKIRQANRRIFKNLGGKILEVGAGDGSRKVEIMARNKNVKEYISTDFSSWDNEFEGIDKRIKKMGKIGEAVFGYKTRVQLDTVCSATKLPFENDSFDHHLSFEVLEHIDDPVKYFSEAARVVRKGGFVSVSVPFMYRIHGGEPEHRSDYYRYANGFFYKIAADNNLEVVELYQNTGFGTTFASLANQFLVRKIYESFWPVRVICLLLSPVLFLFNNLIGYLLDLYPDKRFTTRFHVTLQKN